MDSAKKKHSSNPPLPPLLQKGGGVEIFKIDGNGGGKNFARKGGVRQIGQGGGGGGGGGGVAVLY